MVSHVYWSLHFSFLLYRFRFQTSTTRFHTQIHPPSTIKVQLHYCNWVSPLLIGSIVAPRQLDHLANISRPGHCRRLVSDRARPQRGRNHRRTSPSSTPACLSYLSLSSHLVAFHRSAFFLLPIIVSVHCRVTLLSPSHLSQFSTVTPLRSAPTPLPKPAQ
jgi:hypothetical protein